MALPLELVQHQSGTGSVPLPQLVAGPTGLLVFIAFLIDGVLAVRSAHQRDRARRRARSGRLECGLQG